MKSDKKIWLLDMKSDKKNYFSTQNLHAYA